LLYLEDFQDGQAQGWPEIESRAQNWEIMPDPASLGNQVIQNPGITDSQILFHGLSFEDAVWRIDYSMLAEPTINFHWHWIAEPYQRDQETVLHSTYSISLSDWGLRIVRGREPFPEVVLLDNPWRFTNNRWHEIEISTYFDTLEVWVDGTQAMSYQDPDSLPGGQLGLEIWSPPVEGSLVYFDNLRVCELTGPFRSRFSK